MPNVDLIETVAVLGGLLVSIAWHESAHAWMAWRLGDDTGRLLGRMTLNPIPHIDPFGSVLLPLALYLTTNGAIVFGYAKPVPHDPSRFRRVGRWSGSALVGAAGPVSNILLGGLLALVVVLLRGRATFEYSVGFSVLVHLMVMNFFLAVFNLVPIPPLDGSWVVARVLPDDARRAYLSVGQFGFIVVLLLMRVPAVSNVLSGATYALIDGAIRVWSLFLG